MTTTAHEDQFTAGTQTIQPVLQPYSTEAILRRNIADMEVALKQQTERAEAAEAELAKLAQQKPVAWMDAEGDTYKEEPPENWCPPYVPLYAAPVPAPAVPDEWKLAVADFLSSHDAAWAELFKSLPANVRSVSVSEHQADAVRAANVLRALLQSAPPAPAVPVPALPDEWTEWNGGSVPPVLKDDQRNYEFLRRDGQLAAFVSSWQHGIEGIGARDIVAYRRKAHLLQSAEVAK